jgi:ribosomal protein S18 acetylase RimI-like enzyme
VAGISLPKNQSHTQAEGVRPVNLQTDLAQLADLIETAFSSSMDTGGRAAIREMRQLSRFGMGLGMLSGLNELAQGMSLGYVYVADGKVVGNVSVYPADYPTSMGKVWIIANVAVYPEYRGRGIASQLMVASLDMIQQRSGGAAVLQVDHDNEVAQHLYRKLGFRAERTFAQWRRGSFVAVSQRGSRASSDDATLPPTFRVVGRRLGDAPHELALAEKVRPQEKGGLDWLRPTHINTFRLSFWRRLVNWMSFKAVERLVIRDEHSDHLRAWMQIESSFGIRHRSVLLMTEPTMGGVYADELIQQAVRRFGRDGLVINHPYDDETITDILRRHQFTVRRTVVHMHYAVPRRGNTR